MRRLALYTLSAISAGLVALPASAQSPDWHRVSFLGAAFSIETPCGLHEIAPSAGDNYEGILCRTDSAHFYAIHMWNTRFQSAVAMKHQGTVHGRRTLSTEMTEIDGARSVKIVSDQGEHINYTLNVETGKSDILTVAYSPKAGEGDPALADRLFSSVRLSAQ